METKIKEVKDMTDKELVREWKDIDYHIRNLGVGRWELNHQAELEREMTSRGVNW